VNKLDLFTGRSCSIPALSTTAEYVAPEFNVVVHRRQPKVDW
jgi:hypothetical protein